MLLLVGVMCAVTRECDEVLDYAASRESEKVCDCAASQEGD